MATISNIKEVNSISSENMSMVILEFEGDTDMNAVSLDMREKLDMIKGYWPDEVGNPTIMKLNPDMMPVMVTAMREACHHDLYVLANSVAMNGVGENTTIKFVQPKLLVILKTIATIGVVGFILSLVMFILKKRKFKKSEEYTSYMAWKKELKQNKQNKQ